MFVPIFHGVDCFVVPAATRSGRTKQFRGKQKVFTKTPEARGCESADGQGAITLVGDAREQTSSSGGRMHGNRRI